MHPATILTSLSIWIISLISILCMLIRPLGIAEAYWVCGGSLLLVAGRLLSVRLAGHAVYAGLDVYLFLTGMMILAELAREEGVFDWIADFARRHAHGSPRRLFLLIYCAGAMVTALLSNDATAVVLTPAVLAVVRRAKVAPKPHLLACALIANAASFVLPISNPANLVIYGRHMPPLTQWLGMLILPSAASVGITFVVLRWLSSSELRGRIEDFEEPAPLSLQGKLALFGLLLAAGSLIAASALGLQLGAPTCGAALVAMLIVAPRDRRMPRRVFVGVSWSVLPLVAGLFVIVEALQQAGMLSLAVSGLYSLAHTSRMLADIIAGFSVGLLSNGMNNLPVGLIGGRALEAAHTSGALANAVLVGVDLGPNLSVTGSLATILWLIALRRENVEITAWQFLKAGVFVMPLALLGSILLIAR
jgi:arsenical pump membrane protein